MKSFKVGAFNLEAVKTVLVPPPEVHRILLEVTSKLNDEELALLDIESYYEELYFSERQRQHDKEIEYIFGSDTDGLVRFCVGYSINNNEFFVRSYEGLDTKLSFKEAVFKLTQLVRCVISHLSWVSSRTNPECL